MYTNIAVQTQQRTFEIHHKYSFVHDFVRLTQGFSSYFNKIILFWEHIYSLLGGQISICIVDNGR